MALTLADLFASPDHYLHSFDGADALFVPMDRAAYARSIFLDGRIAPAGEGVLRLPLATLLQRPVPAPAPTGWIFHVAHCGSTLLARALDQAGGNLVLREPLALRQAAVAGDPARLALAAAMVVKRYDPAAVTVVKANVPVNFVLPQLLAPEARALFLHLGLHDYLRAILRSAEHRGWLGRVTAQLAPHLGDLAGAGDAERAAALWLAQMRAFADAIARWPAARSLDAETFFADPRGVLPLAAAQLGLALDAADADALVAGPLFSTYSKNPAEPFDNAARLARAHALEPGLAADHARAERWLAQRAGVDEATAIVAGAALPARGPA